MRTFLLMLAQIGPTDPALPTAHPPHAATCPPPAPGDEVVVCARRDPETFRLRPLVPPDHADDPLLPRAETRIGNATVDVHGEAAAVGGFPTNRAMVGIRLPF